MSTLKIIYSIVFQAYGLVFYLLAWTFFRIRVYGQKKISLQNNLGSIFVARHFSCWDPVLLAAGFWKLQFRHIFLYNRTRYVAKDNLTVLFKCIPCLTSQVIFINQKNVKRNTIREIIDLLREGISIVIFPEGTVVPKNKKVGGLVSMIIEQVEKMTDQRVAIFPVNIKSKGYIYGKPGGSWFNYLMCRVKIDLKIGKPVFLKDLEKIVSKKQVLKKYRREEIVREMLNITDQI